MRKVLIYNFPKTSELRSEVLTIIEEEPGFEITEVKSHDEVQTLIRNNTNVTFIIHADNNMDMIQAKVILAQLKKRILSGQVTPIAISDVQNDKLIKILADNLCKDIMSKDTTAKKILTKIKIITSLFGGDNSDDNAPLVVKSIPSVVPAGDIPKAKPAEFESGKLEIILHWQSQENPSLKSPCKMEFVNQSSVDLELLEKEITIKTEDEVKVEIFFEFGKSKINLEITGFIHDVEPMDNGNKLVAINFATPPEELQQFIKLYQERQDQIHDFMQMARGH